MCVDQVEGVSGRFESNAYSLEGLLNSSQSSSDVVRVKFVLMGRFIVCVVCIDCGYQGIDIVYFLTKTQINGDIYIHQKLI